MATTLHTLHRPGLSGPVVADAAAGRNVAWIVDFHGFSGDEWRCNPVVSAYWPRGMSGAMSSCQWQCREFITFAVVRIDVARSCPGVVAFAVTIHSQWGNADAYTNPILADRALCAVLEWEYLNRERDRSDGQTIASIRNGKLTVNRKYGRIGARPHTRRNHQADASAESDGGSE